MTEGFLVHKRAGHFQNVCIKIVFPKKKAGLEMNNLHNLTQVVSRSLDSEKPRAENLNFHGFKGCRIYLNVLEAERLHLFRHFSI